MPGEDIQDITSRNHVSRRGQVFRNRRKSIPRNARAGTPPSRRSSGADGWELRFRARWRSASAGKDLPGCSGGLGSPDVWRRLSPGGQFIEDVLVDNHGFDDAL